MNKEFNAEQDIEDYHSYNCMFRFSISENALLVCKTSGLIYIGLKEISVQGNVDFTILKIVLIKIITLYKKGERLMIGQLLLDSLIETLDIGEEEDFIKIEILV